MSALESLVDRAVPDEPEAVERFTGILADWLTSYTLPAPLGAEMADALGEGAAWVGAIASLAVRRAGWPDAESVAWGICAAGLAAALEAASWSLDGERGSRDPGATADGPARSLLAADGLIAAAHETLAALDSARMSTAIAALEEAFGDGGPWRHLVEAEAAVSGHPAWPLCVALALAPAAADRPDGPWADLAAAWSDRSDSSDDDEPLWYHRAADRSSRALLRAAAAEARRPRRKRIRAGA